MKQTIKQINKINKNKQIQPNIQNITTTTNNLVLVESPSKAKTIEKYLGKNFKVIATFGHIRDIPSKNGSVEPEKDFLMHYQINPNSKKHIEAITKQLLEYQTNNNPINIYLATDPDREGEAIAWHILEILKTNKKIKWSNININRSIFNEITKDAVIYAIQNPRKIDQNLVDSQQARRALDYLVGFTISPILWKTVGGNKASAGRVQSVALRMMAEKEKEILKFNEEEYWDINGYFHTTETEHVKTPDTMVNENDFNLSKEQKNHPINPININNNIEKNTTTNTNTANTATTKKIDNQNQNLLKTELVVFQDNKIEKFTINNTEKANQVTKDLSQNHTYILTNIENKTHSRSPLPPFTTSSLQQDASKKLNFNSKKTMLIAQKLYEGIKIDGENTGLITYMRTDGLYVSNSCIEQTREMIKNKYGANFIPDTPRQYNNKIKNAQEAHEAIRPTKINLHPEQIKQYLSEEEFKLYQLIYQRMLASQMSNAVYETTNIILESEPLSPLQIQQFKASSNTPTIAQAANTNQEQKQPNQTQQHKKHLTPNNNPKNIFKASFSKLNFPGYLLAYQNDNEEEKNSTQTQPKWLTNLKIGTKYYLQQITPNQHFTNPPARYNEANVIKKMEEIGIGRPSTYATIISVLQERQYACLQNKRFTITMRGHVITDFLTNFFSKYFAYNFTAQMEDDLDRIANGEIHYKSVLKNFWFDFAANAKKVQETELNQIINTISDNIKPYLLKAENDNNTNNQNNNNQTNTNTQPLQDHCPQCKNGKLTLKFSKFGYFLGCDQYPNCKYLNPINDLYNYHQQNNPQQSHHHQQHQEYNHNEIILFADSEIKIIQKQGKYGPYWHIENLAKQESRNLSIGQQLHKKYPDLLQNTPLLKKIANLPHIITHHPKDAAPISLNLGQYGFYVKHQNINTSINPLKLNDPWSITPTQAIELLDKQIERLNKNSLKITLPEFGEITLQKGGYGRIYLIPGKNQYQLTKTKAKSIINIPNNTKALIDKEINFDNAQENLSRLQEILIKLIKKFKLNLL